MAKKEQRETATAPAAPETAALPEAAAAPTAPKPAVKAGLKIGPPFYACKILKAHTTKNGVRLVPGTAAVLPKATIRGEHLLALGIIAKDPRKLAS
jgi:hypothetical protein